MNKEEKFGERLATMENEVKNIGEKSNNIENSVKELHGKLDNFMNNISKNYVAISTFEQYKQTQVEKQKGIWLERVIVILVTAIISGLVAFFLRASGI